MRLNSFSADTTLVALHTQMMRRRENRSLLYFGIGLPQSVAGVHHKREEVAKPKLFLTPEPLLQESR